MSQTQPSPAVSNPTPLSKPKTRARKSGSAARRNNGAAVESDETDSGARVRRVPRQERSRILVDCIRIAAAEILKKDGPKALTTNNIAARAGVSIGSLYQYFANKEQILEEVFRERATRNFEDSRAWANELRHLPIREVIRRIVEHAVTRHREFHSFHPEFYQEHHRELDPTLNDMENGDGESQAVAWLREIFEAHLDELRVPDARLASVALGHGITATLHGLIEGEQGLLYDESIAEKLTAMTCGFLLRDDRVEQRVEPVAALRSN